MFRYKIILFILIIAAHVRSFAQWERSLKFDHITSENIKLEKGISQNTVMCMMQDSRGYMWFGTWDGLNKYDGYNFTIYRKTFFDDGCVCRLSDPSIQSLYEDKEGVFWIGTEGGLNRYDRKNKITDQYIHDPDDPGSVSSDTIYAIVEDNNGYLWLGTDRGLNRFDKKTGRIKRYLHDPEDSTSISNNIVRRIHKDNDGNLWLATAGGLNKFQPGPGSFIRYHYSADKNSICSNDVYCLCQDKEGFLWIGTIAGLNKFDINNETFIHYKHEPGNINSLSFDHVSSVFEDSEGVLWVGTEGGGLNVFNREQNIFYRYKNVANDNSSISNNYILCIYEDNSGNIWLGTRWKGANKINRYSYNFRHYFHISDDRNSINNNLVWYIYEDTDGLLWVATDKGVNIIDRKANTYKYIQNEPGNPNSLISNKVMCIHEDNEGYFWFGTFDKGLDKYDRNNNRFTHYIHDPDNPGSICSDAVNYILQDRFGDIWICTDNGVNMYNREDDSFVSYTHDPAGSGSISNNDVYYMFEDSEGKLWFSTRKGLNLLNRKTGEFYCWDHDPLNEKSISNDWVFGIYEDKEGYLWMGTMGGGLNRFNKKTGEFIHFMEKDGLPNNVVYAILGDNSGHLWMSTNYGLSRFNPQDGTFINYDVRDGIQSNEFNHNVAFKNRKGEMFFGGMNGFNAFYPKDILKNEYVPPVMITAFKIFNEIQEKEYYDGDTIMLSYNDNFFSFEFSALDFTSPYKNNYVYRLRNFDKEWNICNANKRFAEYTNVSPGKYVFTVKGSNNDGIWNEKGISIFIMISPPWWRSYWFRIPLLLVLGIIIWLFVYLRFRQIKKKHEIETRMLGVEMKLLEFERKALRLQMNPHFIFNTLNSIQYYILKNDKKSSNKYLSMFANLMRMTLDNSQHNTIYVKDELEALRLYLELEALRFEEKFDYNIILENNELLDHKIPTMIIQPYVENAVRHGLRYKEGKGKLNIELRKDNKILICCIEDNGIGREKAMELRKSKSIQHVPLGTRITETRLSLISSLYGSRMRITYTDLKDKDGNATGTRVELNIPVMN